MQEDVENKTVNLAISTTQLSGKVLVEAYKQYAGHRAQAAAGRRARANHGRMTVERLLRKDQGAQKIDIARSGIRDFQRILNRYGVDYAIRRDNTEQPPRYMVFFKARDADVLTAAFKEYSAGLAQRGARPSILQALERLRALAPEHTGRVHEKRQERER